MSQTTHIFPEDPPQKPKQGLKTGAKISLLILSLFIIAQLVTIYQTKYQLLSPLIPESTIWEINKQFIFKALGVSTVFLLELIFYFLRKYLIVIILAALALILTRFIVIKPGTDFEIMFF